MIDFGSSEIEREFPKNPLVGVGGIVVKDGRVLVIKRGNMPGRGEWTVPGGLVELGEEMRDAVERELREECGIEVQVGPAIFVSDRIESSEDGDDIRFHYVIIDFLVESFTGKVAAGSDVEELAWVTPAEAKAFGIPKPVRDLIEVALQMAA